MNTTLEFLKTRLLRIAPYFAHCKKGFVMMAVGSAVAAATEPAMPALLKSLFDNGFKGPKFPLWLVPAAIMGIFAVRGLAGLAANYGLTWSANKGTQAMREAMFARMLNSQPTLFSTNTASTLTNTLTHDIQGGANMLVGSLLVLVKDSLTLVAMLGYLIWSNWQLTLFVGVLFPGVVYVMRVLSKRLYRLSMESQDALHNLAYVVEENVLAWRIVRLHGAQQQQTARFNVYSERLKRLTIKASLAASTMTPMTQMIAACGMSAVIVAALWQDVTPGTFMSLIAGMLMLLSPIKHLAEVMGPVTRGLASIEHGINVATQTLVEEGGSFDPGRAQGHIELRDVGLQYSKDLAPALHGIHLELKQGETVALVGPSGAGKSTLVNLIPRFLEPTSGQLLLDGTPVKDWNIAALRRQFALVSQDVVLFNDTVAANVALSGSDPSDPAAHRPRVRAALKAANMLEFIEGLPQGLDTLIGHNGNQLSGGQRQRLAIARAIYKDAPVLILDEATSALDSESERLVQSALETLMRGRTSLVIAHRLSTIKSAHRILVLDAGKVVEQGTHAELLARGGLFAHLHSLQFKSTEPAEV
jgi:ATP-binding cassette, subfamily B, bacterial MsbA